MYEIPDLVEYSLIQMLREKLEMIEEGYPEKTWMKFFFSYTRYSLSELEFELKEENDHYDIKDRDFPIMQEMTHSEIFDMLNCLKHEFLPEDFLFMKACLTKDEQQMGFLLEQALMTCPEDVYLFALSSLFATEDEGFEKLLPIFDQYRKPAKRTGLKLFSDLMRIHAILQMPKGRQNKEELEMLLQNIPLDQEMRCALIYNLSGRIIPGLLLDILDRWKPETKETSSLYDLIKGKLHYRAGEFHKAADLLKAADIQNQPLSDWEKPSFIYMYSKALHFSGQTGKAVLLWQEILNDPEHYDRGTTIYFNSLFDLSRYYVSLGDYKKARLLIINIKEAFRDYLEESRGEEYFCLQGDICLGEAEIKNALQFYEKAFSIAPSGKIAEKIEKIRRVIG